MNGVPLITALVAARVTARATPGCRRITAVLNRPLRSDGLAPVNHTRVCRIMTAHGLRRARTGTKRPGQVRDGKVIVLR